MNEKIYYPIDKQTQEVLACVKAEYRGGMYHIPKNALQSEPLPPKHGFAVIAVLNGLGEAIHSEHIEDHRGTTIYDESDCTKSEVVSELGPIKENFTADQPSTKFDKRRSGVWVTDKKSQFIYEYDRTDSVRRTLYTQQCDPLYSKAGREHRNGNVALAEALYTQADLLAKKIEMENPFPINPL